MRNKSLSKKIKVETGLIMRDNRCNYFTNTRSWTLIFYVYIKNKVLRLQKHHHRS